MGSMDWYNGFSPDEREGMNNPKYRKFARESPCAMCGDPHPTGMQTHAEDYTLPSSWLPPAVYPVCTRCHSRIHSRFTRKPSWAAYLQFLSRGWYAQEVSSDDLHELTKKGDAYQWKQLPHYPPERTGDTAWWWKLLTVDEASKTGPKFAGVSKKGDPHQ